MSPTRPRARTGPALRLVALLTLLLADPGQAAGRGGAVSTAEPEATRVAVEVLADGGNAADAAVAAALALAVVMPQAGNLGGGGFAVVLDDGRASALDFREVAPAAARPDTFLDPDGRPRPEASRVGPLAAGVPGSPGGLAALHRRHGRLPWRRVVGPAEELAREGFTVSPRLEGDLRAARDLLARFPESAATWLPGGAPPVAGDRMRLAPLAATLRLYRFRGPAGVTAGRVAATVVRASDRHGGLLTGADLARHRPTWREPVRWRFRGWELAGMPLPSSGGLLVAQACALLERLRWAEAPAGGVDRAHVLAETWRRTYADRFLLGDPASSAVSTPELLAADWLDRRARSVDPRRATPSLAVAPWPGDAAGAGRGEPDETTHLSVVDSDGMTVALTTTLNGWFGCGLWVPELGFLNNQMDDFTTAPGHPNAFGLVQGEANLVRPGRRMLSSMSPTVGWAEGGRRLALGGRGGSRIPTATLQVLLAVLVDDLPLSEAIDRPRLHHQWWPDVIEAEPGALAPAVRTALRSRGHEVRRRREVGEVHAVRRHADGTLEAAEESRHPRGGACTIPAPGRQETGGHRPATVRPGSGPDRRPPARPAGRRPEPPAGGPRTCRRHPAPPAGASTGAGSPREPRTRSRSRGSCRRARR